MGVYIYLSIVIYKYRGSRMEVERYERVIGQGERGWGGGSEAKRKGKVRGTRRWAKIDKARRNELKDRTERRRDY